MSDPTIIILETLCGCRRVVVGVDPARHHYYAPLQLRRENLAIMDDRAAPPRIDQRVFVYRGHHDDNSGWRIFKEERETQ